MKVSKEIMSITLRSISEAWQEIENGTDGKSNASEFFVEFAKW